jgi:lipoprotein NlpI
MKTITKLPDLANSAKKLKVMIDLMEVLDHTTFWGASIQQSIWNRVPANEVIKTIQESARDNAKMVENVIGTELLQTIQSIQL